jgi:hypothetical protein
MGVDRSQPGRRRDRQHADPGRRSQRLVITCVIGPAGELLAGWAATRLFLTVAAGVVLLPACHPLTERPGHLADR